ncbi:AAA family ATPase [Flavitalea sp. BT771]|uniref:AAA family ATPase n=1 Tax=Flavitalea sp. BT771 TaxID=3063329 RepID=UPI0026E31608|nr:AAA family ATPase [Flavitalea sp. BT771]MDO6433166.1 AAA family ATPase [Flavitalea sp. BT771]MDV6221558.1 AAA family ATPase [Flavitalea sp. BT771]
MNEGQSSAGDQSIDLQFIERMKKKVEESHVDPSGEAAFKLATLHLEFDFGTLTRELSRLFNYSLSANNEETLKEYCSFIPMRDAYALNEPVRTQLLSRMSPPEIKEMIAGMAFDKADWRQRLLNRLISGEIPDLAALSPEEYVQAYTMLRWIKHPDIALPSQASLLAAIRKEAQKAPLRRLTANFSGRETQLARIAAFVRPAVGQQQDSSDFMFITGVGGIGKSTLVSKFILDDLEGAHADTLLFVRIDFDDPGFSLSDITSLMKEALSQLCLQNEKYAERYNQLIERIHSEYEPTAYTGSSSRESDRQSFYMEALHEEEQVALHNFRSPVLIVFDSFEELQYRAAPAQIENLFRTLKGIRRIVPTLKVIFIGRAEIMEEKARGVDLPLENFDDASARTFLHSLGIRDEALSRDIFEKFGGNPLTLQLAANLIVGELPPDKRSVEEVSKAGLFGAIDKELIQQQLVARNLDHVHNKALAGIAVPGMLLRKITPDLIRHVLANVCGLSDIDEQKAQSLFEALKKETFLLKFTGEEVEFRKDLRVSLYDLILKDPKYKALAVHDAAVDYYRPRKSPPDQAEYLFHRLKRGDKMDDLDQIYRPEMKPYLETALSELPAEARVRLSALMGVGTSKEGLDQASLSLWEEYWLAQIKKALDFGDEQQLIALREKLATRKDRSGNPEFLYYEELARTRLLRFEQQPNVSIPGAPVDGEAPITGRFDALVSYRHEFYQGYLKARVNLTIRKQGFMHWPFSKENLRLLIDQYLTVTRTTARLREHYSTYASMLLEAIQNQVMLMPDADPMALSEVFGLFPKPYILPVREWYVRRFPNANLYTPLHPTSIYRQALSTILKDYLDDNNLPKMYMTQDEFIHNYAFLKEHIKTTAELERYARRLYKVYLKDISLPGSLDVSLFDFLLFAEALPRDGRELVLEKLSSPVDFRGKRNVLTPDDYISMAEVKYCLEKLEKTFAGENKRRLIVSDVLDGEGHQYVNLVQRSYGVQLFAVLGYTYILEQMGIRFLKLAGSNTAAIITALFGIGGPKNEEKTTKTLEHLCRLDLRALMDGPPFIARIMKSLGTSPGHAARFLQWITVIFALLIGVYVLDILTVASQGHKVRSSPYLMAAFVAVNLIVGFLILYIAVHFARLARFGAGLNPGRTLFAWIKKLFSDAGIRSVEEMIQRTETAPALEARQGTNYNTLLLKGNVTFLCADIISQNRILFPQMSSLFWTKEQLAQLDPAIFVRAAVSAPFVFDAYTLDNIPVKAPEIKQAWIDLLGEYDPPGGAAFADGGVFSLFPITLFQGSGENAPMPTFGVDTKRFPEKIGATPIRRLSWGTYIMRLLDTTKYNLDRDQVTRGKAMEKAICNIGIKKIGSTGYFLSDEEKLELFIYGAQAASDFLIGFDWEAYKRGLNTPTSLRL